MQTKFVDMGDDNKISRHERRIEEIEELEVEINTEIKKEELDELKMFQEMRSVGNDN